MTLMGGFQKFLPTDNVNMFLFIFVIFFIKVYLVQFSYNFVAPKLINDFGNEKTNNLSYLHKQYSL